jgi:hypothetical protein
MSTHRRQRFRPHLERVEDRCLLSLAVLEIENQTTYNITFEFRWTPTSSWTTYTETPGYYEILWADYSTSLAPQVHYNTTTSPDSQTTVNLVQGYNQWFGTGTPPTSAATLYQFQDTATGLDLYYISSPPPTLAVLSVQNNSTWTITFSFRWTPTSSWTAYTELPGDYETFWTDYSTSLIPQALYDTTSSPDSQTTVNLAQGYDQWTGTGSPPESAATPYEYINTSTDVRLYYWDTSPSPTPTPTPVPTPTPTPTPVPTSTPTPTPSPTPSPTPQPILPPTTSNNWSGYVAATSISEPMVNSVSAVFGSWIVPAVSGRSRATTDSCVWVGIDGSSNSTVEQIGTGEDVLNGRSVYYAWWEMYSSGIGQPQQFIKTMSVGPGDSITASVQYIASGANAGDFDLSITDNSRPNDSFSTYQSSAQTQSPLAQRETAEWIVEAPGVGGGFATLADFGRVTFSNASAVIDGVSGPIDSASWQSQAMNIASNGGNSDSTSGLTDSGSSFVVTYGSSAVTAVRRHSKHHGKRLRHAALGSTQRANPATDSMSGGTVRNGTSIVSGFRAPIRQPRRPARETLIGSLWD